MAAGSLKQYVRVEVAPKVSDGRGGFSTGPWATYMEGPAQIVRLAPKRRDTERLVAGAVFSEVVTNIVMRWTPEGDAITSDMRVIDVDTGKTFNILAAQNIDGDNKFLTITAMEGAPA